MGFLLVCRMNKSSISAGQWSTARGQPVLCSPNLTQIHYCFSQNIAYCSYINLQIIRLHILFIQDIRAQKREILIIFMTLCVSFCSQSKTAIRKWTGETRVNVWKVVPASSRPYVCVCVFVYISSHNSHSPFVLLWQIKNAILVKSKFIDERNKIGLTYATSGWVIQVATETMRVL